MLTVSDILTFSWTYHTTVSIFVTAASRFCPWTQSTRQSAFRLSTEHKAYHTQHCAIFLNTKHTTEHCILSFTWTQSRPTVISLPFYLTQSIPLSVFFLSFEHKAYRSQHSAFLFNTKSHVDQHLGLTWGGVVGSPTTTGLIWGGFVGWQSHHYWPDLRRFC